MKYTYIGGGMGVPGLPHEISDEEANEQGVTALLKAAIENGSYVVADETPHLASLTPSPSPEGRGERKLKKE